MIRSPIPLLLLLFCTLTFTSPPCTDHTTRICDENQNHYGPNECHSDSDCYAGRYCSTTGYCSGRALNSSAPACTDHTTRTCDESLNVYGPYQCQVDQDCYQGRYCSASGYCYGNASDSSSSMLWLEILLPIMFGVIIFIIVVCCIQRRNRKKREFRETMRNQLAAGGVQMIPAGSGVDANGLPMQQYVAYTTPNYYANQRYNMYPVMGQPMYEQSQGPAMNEAAYVEGSHPVQGDSDRGV